jgi:hypothetical protein
MVAQVTSLNPTMPVESQVSGERAGIAAGAQDEQWEQ